MQRRRRDVEAFDAEQVARAAHVAQFQQAVHVGPQRDDALLDDADVVAVRLALREDVLVALVKAHAPVPRKRQQVAIVHRLKRRILFEEVSYTIADRCRFHFSVKSRRPAGPYTLLHLITAKAAKGRRPRRMLEKTFFATFAFFAIFVVKDREGLPACRPNALR